METGNLTPKSNDTISEFSYTGAFELPDGFGSILTCRIAKSGDATLSLLYKMNNEEHMWEVILDNEQRRVLANQLLSYEPVLWDKII